MPKTRKKPAASHSMIRESVDVEAPLQTTYNQWTQFEEFPRFMEGVEAVRQVDACHLHWQGDIGRKRVEWEAVISEQVPDTRIAWHSTAGAKNSGTVTFDRLADRRTRVTLELEYEPEGFVENAGDFLGFVSQRAKGDLRRFKDFIEKRGHETGAWRGRIPSPESRS